METPQFITSLLSWLRAGYPEGVPATDYSPLLALLRRRVSDDEATDIAARLIEAGGIGPQGQPRPISKIDAGVLITRVINELHQPEDIERVRQRLERLGWPFDAHPLPPPDPDRAP